MKVENLPALTHVGKTLFATYEVAGKNYTKEADANVAAFEADKALLLEKLDAWMANERYKIRHFSSSLPTERTKARLKVFEMLDSFKFPLKCNQSPASAGRYVWEHIQGWVVCCKPNKQQTQSFVNWFRLDHLIGLFVHRYGPKDALRNDPDPRADEYAWDALHR